MVWNIFYFSIIYGTNLPIDFHVFKMVKTTNQPQLSNYVSQLDLQFWGSPPFLGPCGSPCIAQEIIAKPQNIIHNSTTNHPRVIQKSLNMPENCPCIHHGQADTEAANSTAARAETLGWDKHEVRPYTVKAHPKNCPVL